MKKILVPTDFSGNANKALDYAIELAALSKAEVMILYASQVNDSSIAFPINMEYVPYVGNGEEVNRKLSVLKEQKSGNSEVNISTHLYAGFILESILKASDDLGADLVVMGTLGDSGAMEKLFGSVTAAVIGKTKIPVLVIPLMAEWSLPKKILFAINDFDEDPGRIDMLIRIADLFNAEIEIAVFIDEDTADAAEYMEKARGISFYEDKINDHFGSHKIKATRLYGSKLQDSLDDYIKSQQADILAMVTHKRNLLEQIFTLSITKKISYHTDIPLLVLPA